MNRCVDSIQVPHNLADKPGVERRREPRISIDQVVVAACLNNGCEEPFEARVMDASGRGVRLRIPRYIAAGTAIKMELKDQVFLGEVIYCSTEGDQLYAGVEIAQAFCLTPELARLWQALRPREVKQRAEARSPVPR